ncbi:MAG TPA: HAMP domain-containing sensor histidine kinase [Myxococcaceae bacterium]|nr:HAMP domain-containing sensor histidine kinase [Myxococcaceae bacterium]
MQGLTNVVAIAGARDAAPDAPGCSDAATWDIDTKREDWRCSSASAALLGLGEGDSPLTLLDKEDGWRFREAIAESFQDGDFQFDLHVEDRWFRAQGRCRNEPGRPRAISGTLQDVTDLKEAILEGEVRLADLGAALVAPLSAVRHCLLSARRSGPAAEVVLDRAQALLGTLEKRVADLLDYGAARFAPVNRVPIPLSEVCRAAMAEAMLAHGERTVHLDLHQEPWGRWDPAAMRRAIRHLLEFALWRGRTDAPVELAVVDLSDRAIVSVWAHGPRIDGGDAEQLFSPFGHPGGGPDNLGMYIARRIVEAHGGRIEVSSDDVRTLVRATLPKRSPDAAAH